MDRGVRRNYKGMLFIHWGNFAIISKCTLHVNETLCFIDEKSYSDLLYLNQTLGSLISLSSSSNMKWASYNIVLGDKHVFKLGSLCTCSNGNDTETWLAESCLFIASIACWFRFVTYVHYLREMIILQYKTWKHFMET